MAKKPVDGTTPGGMKPGKSGLANAAKPNFNWEEGPHYLNKIGNNFQIIQVRLGGNTGAKAPVADDKGSMKARAKNQSNSKKR